MYKKSSEVCHTSNAVGMRGLKGSWQSRFSLKHTAMRALWRRYWNTIPSPVRQRPSRRWDCHFSIRSNIPVVPNASLFLQYCPNLTHRQQSSSSRAAPFDSSDMNTIEDEWRIMKHRMAKSHAALYKKTHSRNLYDARQRRSPEVGTIDA